MTEMIEIAECINDTVLAVNKRKEIGLESTVFVYLKTVDDSIPCLAISILENNRTCLIKVLDVLKSTKYVNERTDPVFFEELKAGLIYSENFRRVLGETLSTKCENKIQCKKNLFKTDECGEH